MPCDHITNFAAGREGQLRVFVGSDNIENKRSKVVTFTPDGKRVSEFEIRVEDSLYDVSHASSMCCSYDGRVFFTDWGNALIGWLNPDGSYHNFHNTDSKMMFGSAESICLSPDQSQLYLVHGWGESTIAVFQISGKHPVLRFGEYFNKLELPPDKMEVNHWPDDVRGMCVDTNGWLYATTEYGIQVFDQAGRVNFIMDTPAAATAICFGGKDLSELFIACGDTIFKRPTKAKGVISGQQAPVKPPAPRM